MQYQNIGKLRTGQHKGKQTQRDTAWHWEASAQPGDSQERSQAPIAGLGEVWTRPLGITLSWKGHWLLIIDLCSSLL